jgi:hypothetical protein
MHELSALRRGAVHGYALIGVPREAAFPVEGPERPSHVCAVDVVEVRAAVWVTPVIRICMICGRGWRESACSGHPQDQLDATNMH